MLGSAAGASSRHRISERCQLGRREAWDGWSVPSTQLRTGCRTLRPRCDLGTSRPIAHASRWDRGYPRSVGQERWSGESQPSAHPGTSSEAPATQSGQLFRHGGPERGWALGGREPRDWLARGFESLGHPRGGGALVRWRGGVRQRRDDGAPDMSARPANEPQDLTAEMLLLGGVRRAAFGAGDSGHEGGVYRRRLHAVCSELHTNCRIANSRVPHAVSAVWWLGPHPAAVFDALAPMWCHVCLQRPATHEDRGRPACLCGVCSRRHIRG